MTIGRNLRRRWSDPREIRKRMIARVAWRRGIWVGRPQGGGEHVPGEATSFYMPEYYPEIECHDAPPVVADRFDDWRPLATLLGAHRHREARA